MLLKLSLRSIQQHPLRTLLSILGITIGVAAILALRITNQASIQAITRLFEESSGRVDLTISPSNEDLNLTETTIRIAENFPDVELVLPVVEARSAIPTESTESDLQLSFFGIEGGAFLLHGIDPLLEPQVRDYEITAGRFLGDDLNVYEVVLVEDFASDEEIVLGDRIEIVTPNGIERLRVVGLMARQGPGQINNGNFGVIPIMAAQQIFNRVGEFDRLDLLLTESSNSQAVEALRTALQARLGDKYSVTYPANQGQRMSQMLFNYQIGLNFLSGIALFVGAFLIYNAFAMTVVERTREFGMLRTVGMTRRQVLSMVLLEALAMGVLGSALGLLLGIFGARGLAGLVGSLIGAPLTADLDVPAGAVILSLAVGLIVTLLGALMPSLQASRVSPIAALRVRGRSQNGWFSRSGWKLGLAMLLVSTAVLFWNPFPYDPQFILGSLTVFLMFGGVTLLMPSTVTLWEKITRPLMRLTFRNSGLIGSKNIQRSKIRTTLTTVALLIGVAMILVVRIMIGSLSGDLLTWLDGYFGGDIYAHSSIPLRSELAGQISGVAGVVAATPINYYEIEIQPPTGDPEPLLFMAIDPATYPRVTQFVFSDAAVDPLAALSRLNQGDAVFVSSVMAEKYGYAPGDALWIKTNQGWKDFEVAAVVVDFYNQGMVLTGSRHDLRRYFRSNEISTLLINIQDDADISVVMDNIDKQFGQRYNLSLVSNTNLREDISTLLDQAFSMFDVMAVLAVAIASLGIVNTLTMNILERRREIGMLRAIGMTRGQVVRMVLAEAGLMGLVGGGIGLGFGILLSRIFLSGMTAMSGYKLDFIVPLGGVITSLIVALVVTQVAALYPAQKAAKTDILAAIQYE